MFASPIRRKKNQFSHHIPYIRILDTQFNHVGSVCFSYRFSNVLTFSCPIFISKAISKLCTYRLVLSTFVYWFEWQHRILMNDIFNVKYFLLLFFFLSLSLYLTLSYSQYSNSVSEHFEFAMVLRLDLRVSFQN